MKQLKGGNDIIYVILIFFILILYSQPSLAKDKNKNEDKNFIMLSENDIIKHLLQPSWKNIHLIAEYRDSFELQLAADDQQTIVPLYVNLRKQDRNIVLNSIYKGNWQTEHVYKYTSDDKKSYLDMIIYKIGHKNILIKINIDDFSDRYVFQVINDMESVFNEAVDINIKCNNNILNYCLNITTISVDNVSHFNKPHELLEKSLTKYASDALSMTYRIHDHQLSNYYTLNQHKSTILILFIYDISSKTLKKNNDNNSSLSGILNDISSFKNIHTGYWSQSLFGLCSFDGIYNDKIIDKFTDNIVNSMLFFSKTFEDSIRNYDDPIAACISSMPLSKTSEFDIVLPIKNDMYLSQYSLKWLYYAMKNAYDSEETEKPDIFSLTSLPFQLKVKLPLGVFIIYARLNHDKIENQAFAFTSKGISSFLNQKISNLHTITLSQLLMNNQNNLAIYTDFSDLCNINGAQFVSFDNDDTLIKEWHWMMSLFPKKPLYIDNNGNYDPENHWDHDIHQISRSLKSAVPLLGLYGGFLMINEGFFDMTSSWVCNAISVCGDSYPIERTTLLCTDRECLRKAYNTPIYNRFGGIIGIDLQKHANRLLSDYMKSTDINIEFKKEMGFSQIGYIAMMMMRAKIIHAIVEEGVPFMLFETDAVWGTDAFKHIDDHYIDKQKLITEQNWDLIYYHDNPTSNGVGGGFFIQSANDNAKKFYSEWIIMLEQDFESSLREARDYERNKGGITWKEQSALQELVRPRKDNQINPIQPGFGGTRILLLSQEEYVRGLWYEGHNPLSTLKKEIVIQNNYIIGIESKIQRAKRYNHWFLKDDRQSCMLTDETQMIININLPTMVKN